MRVSIKLGWLACALFGAGAATNAAAQYGGDYREVIRCESRDYRQVYCDIDSRGGVEIVNQLSDTACVEGRSWGWDRRGVWVSGGCRGEFAVAGRGYGPGPGAGYDRGYGYDQGHGSLIRCESRDYNQVYCDADTRGGVRLVNQLSSTACVRGQTWGADRRGVWVRGGCRAEFEVGDGFAGDPGGGGGVGGGGGGFVVCESRDNRYRHCPAWIRRDVRILRQLSSTPCIPNRSWGYDRNGVWVDRGCRAEFEVF